MYFCYQKENNSHKRKRKMKKLVIAAIIFILPLLSHTAFAQRGGGLPEERAEKQTAMMREYLDLTDEQLPKIEEINLKFAKNNEELREKYRGDRETIIAAFRESEQLKEEALAQVLTEEQMNKLQEKKAEMRSQRRGRGSRGRRN